MSVESVINVQGLTNKNIELTERFLRWQCRVRQIAMRDHFGRPDDAITPALTLLGETEPMGHIITLISKWGVHSKTPEMKHMVKRTNDQAQRRDKALEFFQSTYYQNIQEFNDSLTATFPPGSPGAEKIEAAGECTLTFEAYGQRFDLECAVNRLSRDNPMYQATYWHNLLFNPTLHPDIVILQFAPNWNRSRAQST
jgi:hypothetical protein